MRTLTLILSLAVLTITSAFALNTEEQFKQANEAYAGKDYAKASQLYQTLVDSGYQSANLYFNLGNAYYKLNKTAECILYLEKAKKLEPGNEDILFNLRVANLRVADKVETLPELRLVSKLKDLLAGKSSNGWGKLAVLFIWLALIGGAVFVFAKQPVLKRVGFFGGLLLLLVSLATMGIAWGQYNREKDNRFAILFATNTYIKSAPDAQSMDLFILREGVKVEVLDTTGDWDKIKVPDAKGDKVGWISKDLVREI